MVITPFKVIGADRKLIYDFLFIVNANLASNLYHFHVNMAYFIR